VDLRPLSNDATQSAIEHQYRLPGRPKDFAVDVSAYTMNPIRIKVLILMRSPRRIPGKQYGRLMVPIRFSSTFTLRSKWGLFFITSYVQGAEWLQSWLAHTSKIGVWRARLLFKQSRFLCIGTPGSPVTVSAGVGEVVRAALDSKEVRAVII
jgi:hypothetical protein